MDLFEALFWLVLNVYHEARSEDFIGKKAVAHVVLNRRDVRGLSIKEVIKQPYQFSWTHQIKNPIPKDLDSFLICWQAVEFAINEYDFTRGATYYHLETIRPEWVYDNDMIYIGKFGTHMFYKKQKVVVIKPGNKKKKYGKNKNVRRDEKVSKR